MNCEDSYPFGGEHMVKGFSKMSRATFEEYAQSLIKTIENNNSIYEHN